MKFSIVTPAFNALAGLRRCVGSVRGQTGPQWEHLVIDGGSTDGTAQWLEGQGMSLAGGESAAIRPEGGSPLRWLSEPDKGMYDAINKGWMRACGDILSWLNSDEQYLPGTLSRVEHVFQERPDVDFLFGDTIMVDPEGCALCLRREIPLRMPYLLSGFLYALSCTMFFRRQLWDEGILRIDSSFRTAGDCDLVMRLLRAGKRSLHLPSYLSLFGIHGGNLSVSLAKGALVEDELIKRKYGFIPRPLRRVVMMGRYLERLAAGCYRPDTVSYQFALNERPTYKTVTASRMGFRFTYPKAMREIARRQWKTGP